jgi:hypothetical protein
MNFWLLLFLPLLNTIMRWDEYLHLLNPSYFSCKTGGAVNMTPFPFLLTLIDVLSYFILYSYAFIYNKYISNYLFSIFIIVFTRRYNNYIFPFPLNIKKNTLGLRMCFNNHVTKAFHKWMICVTAGR